MRFRVLSGRVSHFLNTDASARQFALAFDTTSLNDPSVYAMPDSSALADGRVYVKRSCRGEASRDLASLPTFVNIAAEVCSNYSLGLSLRRLGGVVVSARCSTTPDAS
jgi:hypothetical protein